MVYCCKYLERSHIPSERHFEDLNKSPHLKYFSATCPSVITFYKTFHDLHPDCVLLTLMF